MNEIKVGNAVVFYTMSRRQWRELQGDIASGTGDDVIMNKYLPAVVTAMSGVQNVKGDTVASIESAETLDELDAKFVNALWMGILLDVSGAEQAAPFLQAAAGATRPAPTRAG